MKMSENQYTHYDVDHDGRGKSLLVLDSFRLMAEAIDNDVIPASRMDNVIPGVETPASTLSSDRGTQNYTTIRLSPADRDVNFLPENYVHHTFAFEFECDVDHAPQVDQDFAIYTPSSWDLPDYYAFRIGGTSIHTNQYQREESTVTMASLPQEIIQTNNEFVTMSKIARREPIPGEYITWKAGQTTQNFTVTIDTTADLSHISPVISNIPFVTSQMGDLSIRLFYNNMERALMVTPIPSSLYNGTNLTLTNFHVLEQLPISKPVKFKTDTIQPLAESANTIGAKTDGQVSTFNFRLKSWKAINNGVEIVQCNFSLKQESVDAITSYIAEDNKLVIPTQNWTVTPANSAPLLTPGFSAKTTFNISAYNIYLLAFLFPYTNESAVYFPHPKLSNVDIRLGSNSIIYGAYSYIDARAVKDTVQALLNVDRYGANENIMNSMVMNPFSNGFYNKDIYASVYSNTGGPVIHRPNSFVIAKGLSPPNSFEKGYCVNSKTGSSAIVTLFYNAGEDLDAGIDQLNPGRYTGEIQPLCLALQDCCIVLTYNPKAKKCQVGELNYVEPWISA